MYGGRLGDSSGEEMEEPLDNEPRRGHAAANGNTRNGNLDPTPPAEAAADSMEVSSSSKPSTLVPQVDTAARGTSILSNPARFEALIR